MGTTPTYSWPYPDDTDPVANGAQDIEDLALAVESTVSGLTQGSLVLIDSTTVGSAVASVTISSVFSATYDTYLVVINGVAGSVVAQLQLNYAGATTSYYGATRAIDFAGSLTNVLANNAAHMYVGQVGTAVQQNSAIWIGGPFISERTSLHGTWIRGAVGGYMMGSHDIAASYTGFTIAPSAGTITGGTISTYGVAKS